MCVRYVIYECTITVWGCAEMLNFSFLNGSIPDSLHTSFPVKSTLADVASFKVPGNIIYLLSPF